MEHPSENTVPIAEQVAHIALPDLSPTRG